MDRISVHGIQVWGHHGVLRGERDRGQPFVIDVTVEADLRSAAASDDLADTVDYATLAQDVADAATGGPHDLVETLAARVAEVVLAHPLAVAVEVTVHKPHVLLPVPCAGVSVTLRRKQDA